MKKLIFLTLALSLSGCMVGPNYKTPENAVADEWSAPSDAIDSTPLAEWWTVFNDPLLNKYIDTAAEFNKNVLIAEANVLEARATRMVTASALYPHIGADLNAGEFRFSKNGLIFGPAAATGKSPQAQSLYTALFDAVWELDLFGKTRRSVEAADATLASTIEQRNNTLISVFAELARNYIEIRSYQKQAYLTKTNILLLEQQALIVQKQLEFGYVNLLTYETLLANLATAKAALPDIQASIYRGIYALSVLTGALPETLLGELLEPKALPKTPETIAIGLRSELLRRRPDVRTAERQLAAATANIGVAVASFFPHIVLGGIGGLQSLHLNNLFTGDSNIWGVGGNASVPLFEGGKLVGTLHVNQAAMQVAFQTYQQAVLAALEETESALATYTQEKVTALEYREAVNKYQILVGLSGQRYEKGLTNRVDYLTSEQKLIAAEQSLLQSDTLSLIDLIALYKALGGGWEMGDCTTIN